MKHLDKITHFLAGFFITTCFGFVGIIPALCIGIFAGIAKEAYDLKSGRVFDWIDLLATVIGSGVGALFLIL
jgi:hypothetical protein